MKIMNKIMLGIFACLALSHTPSHGWWSNDGYPSGALSGAAIGGLAGGRRGAAIGLGVGAFADITSAAARNDRRRREREYREYRDNYRQSQPQQQSQSMPSKRQLLDENAELRARLQQYEN